MGLTDTRVGPARRSYGAAGRVGRMFGWIRNLILYRFLGGRLMLAFALLGIVRRLLGGRRPVDERSAERRGTTYQPSQGSSQMVQRDPR